MASLIHPRMLSSLEATFYVATCTIQEATETQDAYGQPIPAWADVVGLTDLACSVAALSENEQRRPVGTISEETHHISIAGYYAAVLPTMRAVVATVNYDIVAVEYDSHNIMTRLRTRLVT